MVISASLQACGVGFPFAMLTSICRSIVTICSGLYLLIGMTCFSSKWIFSHSTWYKNPRSRQLGLQLRRVFLILWQRQPKSLGVCAQMVCQQYCVVGDVFWQRPFLAIQDQHRPARNLPLDCRLYP